MRKAYEKDSLRICLISYRSNPHCGGQGVYIRNLSRALTDLGHDVEVVAGPPDPQLHDDVTLTMLPCLDLFAPENMFRFLRPREMANPINIIEWLGVSTGGFPEPFTFGFRAHKYLRNNFKKFDIVHDNQSLSFGLRNISRFIPTVATIHHPITIDRDIALKSATATWEKLKHLKWFSFLHMQKQISQTISHIITVSDSAMNDISNEFNIPKERFRVVPNGINTNLFYPMPEIARGKNRIIVTNSADMPLKGLYFLLHAISNISKKRDIKLIVIGAPKKNGIVEKLVRDLELERFVTFTGRVDDDEFVRQYAKASVAVIPSVYEGFGLPVGEAMACGVPVISTSGGALPEVVGDAGIIVPPSDHEALSRAITDLLDNPVKAKELGVAGYKRVQEFFTWKKAAEKTVDVYREAIRDYS